MRQKVPARSTQRPDAKRARLDSAEPEAESIEQRILTGAYQSSEEVLDDVSRVRDAASSATTNGATNGESRHSSPNDPVDAAEQFTQLLTSQNDGAPLSNATETTVEKQHAGHIIMLRSTTDKGVSMLYSGLQSQSTEDKDLTKEARLLPNGFDLAEPATMDANVLAPTKQPRRFGDVFGPHRNTKALEMPRSRTALRSNTLSFSSDPFPDRPASMNRQDYKHQQLATGAWLDYTKSHALSEQDPSRKYKDKSAATNDFRAALIANDVSVNDAEDSIALFKKAYSSFVPTSDSSASLIADHDRNRYWWRKYGARRIRKIFTSAYPDPDTVDTAVADEQAQDDDFSDVVNFVPSEGEEEPSRPDEPQNLDEVLYEISQLLETVHSFQRMRSLETRPSADTTKPSSDEFDAYEMLRSQLAILIETVPPFAVTKLDGDKLADLNISTNVMVEAVDYRGTMQPDDFTLSKYRTAQPSVAPRMPQTGTPVARPTYPGQNNMGRYNPNLQSYAHNLGLQAQYAARQAQQYSTPQNLQRNYQPYQQTGNYSQPNLQQFQRPAANGYGGWNSNTTKTPQTNFSQMPSQPGYQQRAQQQGVYAATPSRPMPNGGQAGYQGTPQYQRPQLAAAQQSFSPTPQQQTAQQGIVNGGQ